MPLALLVLALSSFAIGTTEFVIMGLLPEVAADLSVTIPHAGWLVTGYALAVAIGAPVMAISTAKLKRRTALIALMAFFITGNLLCALASDYWVLMIARIVTALCHGAFFGIGSVVAAGLVAEDRKARAVALMFTGLTLANVLGVPLGTAVGQAYGWRATFGVVTVVGIVTILGLISILPKDKKQENGSILREIAALRNGGLWLALSTTVFFAASMFALFTYIAPLLRDVTGVSPEGVTGTLFLIGLGLTVGNLIGGKLPIGVSASLLPASSPRSPPLPSLSATRAGSSSRRKSPSSSGRSQVLPPCRRFRSASSASAGTRRTWSRRSISGPSTPAMRSAPGLAASSSMPASISPAFRSPQP
ncbi:probable MFS transporter protein [Rhizobium etli CFN 42]|uniref:Probable MFS transporter protein n=1 Tax=Rhizobium etli (strain ATCC 51251 / DSM 11541 / JCM 21823 / NBRC 15573 / CFN 42) TaxID=347834 RepID=Q2K5Z1_RHIEC|nr:probable MFS transporter protein [Rhizobium etli CFN 42]